MKRAVSVLEVAEPAIWSEIEEAVGPQLRGGRVLDATRGQLPRTRFLPAYLEVMLATGELDAARAASRELDETAAAYAERAPALNTRRAYRADWAHFEAWCRKYGAQPLPARQHP